jgi:glutamate synthase domain-containing protein 3
MTGGRVVILGTTGRNFAAGMSGGIAYVYDVEGKFREKCNTIMVDLLPVVFDDDLREVRGMIKEFHQKTGSEVARGILEKWPKPMKKFIKVGATCQPCLS